FGKESAHELALIQAHPLFQLRVLISAPIDGDGTPPDTDTRDQQMLRLLRSPVQTQAHGAGFWQLPDERASVRQRQRFDLKPRVVQQARQSLRGGFKVIKETSQSSLAATLHQAECAHEVRDGFLLVPVCIGQNKTDILAEASGQGVLSHRKPMLSRVNDS